MSLETALNVHRGVHGGQGGQLKLDNFSPTQLLFNAALTAPPSIGSLFLKHGNPPLTPSFLHMSIIQVFPQPEVD